MTTIRQEFESFAEFARRQFDHVGVECSLEELFDQWRLQHPTSADSRAIQASIRDMERGETGREFGEFAEDFRSRNGITE